MDIQKERKAFEAYMADRYKSTMDQRVCINSDGDYMAWDMQVAWNVWKTVKAQAVPNLHYEILVKSIIEHVDSHLEHNFLDNDPFDRGWNSAMRCVRNNITRVSKRKDLANAKN